MSARTPEKFSCFFPAKVRHYAVPRYDLRCRHGADMTRRGWRRCGQRSPSELSTLRQRDSDLPCARHRGEGLRACGHARGREVLCGRLSSGFGPRRAEAAAHDRQARLAMDARDGAQQRQSGCSPRSRPAAIRQRRARKSAKALTFSELIDLYLAEGVGHKKASTLKADRGRIEHHLRPLLGKLRADRIGRADDRADAQLPLPPGRRPRGSTVATKRRPGSIATGGKGAAAQCVALVGSIYRLRDRARTYAPTTRRAASRKRPSARSSASCRKRRSPGWPKRSTRRRERSGNPYPSAAIKLLLLTGCRKRRDRQSLLGSRRFRARMPAAPRQQDRR